MTACFSIFASGPHLDATITTENIMFNCGPLIMDASIILEEFSVGPRFPLLI